MNHLNTSFGVPEMCIPSQLELLQISRLTSRLVRPRWGQTILLCLLACFSAFALDPNQPLTQLHHTTWTAKDGLNGTVAALAQTTDGYLWVGTTDGLLRFDGISFEKYKPERNQLPSPSVAALYAVPDGSLWIGYQTGGATHLVNGEAINYQSEEGFPIGHVRHFVQDRDGTMWASAAGGFVRLEGGRWQKVRKDWGFPSSTAWNMLVDHDGTLWAAAENRIVYLPRGEKKFHDLGIETGPVFAFTQLPDGTFLYYDDSRGREVIRAFRSPLDLRSTPLPDIRVRARDLLIDRDGAIWIVASDLVRIPHLSQLYEGTIRANTPGIEKMTSDQGLTDPTTFSVLEDKEGNIWVGTRAGLERFRRRNLSWYPFPRGTGLYSLVANDLGDVWVGSRGEEVAMGIFRPKNQKAIPGSSDTIYLMYRDPDGAIWIASKNLFQLWKRGRFTTIPPPEPSLKLHLSATKDPIIATSITKDRSGTLWVSFAGTGVFQWKDGTWKLVPVLKDHPDWSTTYAYTDAADRVWLAYSTRMAVVDHGNTREFSARDGLTVGPFKAIGGRDEQVWIGGENGLSFLKNGRFYTLHLARGMDLGVVNGIVSPSNDGLWLSTGTGIVHIAEDEVQKVLRDVSCKVTAELLDVDSDLPEQLQKTNFNVSDVALANDGALWFATLTGAARVDPAAIYHNPVPPPVAIRAVVADEKSYSVFANASLPALTKNLRIDYTALSLTIPQRVRFRYRLEGWENEFQEVGARRQAFYEKLPPGNYRFHVIACNNDGVWNETGATMSFSVAPAWYQTIWFYSFWILAFALVILGLHHLRLRQVARQFTIRLEERVGERTRIARELHDTLLQNLHGVMFEFQAAKNLLHRDPQRAEETIESAIAGTEEAIAESQRAIEELRSSEITESDFVQLLDRLGKELTGTDDENQPSPSFRVIVEGLRRRLSPSIQDQVYSIARETIRNSCHHANATEIEAEIRYDLHEFRLRIRDNGKGISREVLEAGKRAGHWGLPGIDERARRMGGKLDLWSESGAGTEVQLTVPGSVAYRKSPAPKRFRIRNKD